MKMKQNSILAIFLISISIAINLISFKNIEARTIDNENIIVETFSNPVYSKEKSYLFYPKNTNLKRPVIFFCHGYGGTNPQHYNKLIENIVNEGYIVVYVPYPILPPPIGEIIVNDKYKALWAGIEEAVYKYGSIMDLSKIGFVGHSFGAGAIPSLSYKAITELGWGSSGAFLYMMAPWYSYGITEEQLKDFPKNVKLVMEVFNDDSTNDHRMAKDIFEHINISNNEKDFITLFSSSNSTSRLYANHMVPLGDASNSSGNNELDTYGVFRIFNSLADYTFNHNKESKNIALGNGSKEQKFMGLWNDGSPIKELDSTDTPTLTRVQSFYEYNWDNPFNPRKDICSYSNEKDGFEILNFKEPVSLIKEWKIRFNSKIDIKTLDNTSVDVFDNIGNSIEVRLSLENENTVLRVTPIYPYSPNSNYSLYVNKGILSSKKSFLKKAYVLNFTTTKTN